jgi:hypothetical protein
MQTARDAEIVAWIGRLGAAGAEHVMGRFGMSRSMAYHRLGLLTKDRLLEHRGVLFGRPGLYTATRAGLRWRGLDRLGVFRVGPGAFEHAWQVAQAAVELHCAMPGWEVLSEREVRSVEADGEGLFASAQVGGGGGERNGLHRPDLVLLSPERYVVAVEVELSIKSASRLVAICRGWARARHIDGVCYLAPPGPARAVERAVSKTRVGDRVRVFGLDDMGSLAAEWGGRGSEDALD